MSKRKQSSSGGILGSLGGCALSPVIGIIILAVLVSISPVLIVFGLTAFMLIGMVGILVKAATGASGNQ